MQIADDHEQSPRDWASHVIHGAPALIAYIDRDQRFRFVNLAHQAWLGVLPEDLVGRRVAEVIDELSLQRAGSCLEQALAGQPAVYEGEMFSGPAQCYVHGSFQPDFADDGSVRGVFTVFIDITERYAMESRLRESEARLFGTFQNAAVGMALVTPDGQLLRVNAALCSMLGYREEEMLKLTIGDITYADDVTKSRVMATELMSGKRESYQLEKRYVHRDGHIVHVQLSVSLVRAADGTPFHAVALIADISQRKAYEEALFRERELAEVTLRSIGDAVITTDLQHRVTSLNPIAEAMTGWSQSAAIGRHVSDVFRLIDGQTREPMLNPLLDAILRDAIVELRGDAMLVHRNGFETPIEDSAASIHDHAGNVIGGVLVFHDVSATRALVLKMAHMAQHDTLTGLPNRSLLQSRLEQVIVAAGRRQSRAALIFINLDHFKLINDTLGHKVGDQLLRTFATHLRGLLRSEDTVSRTAGDEFMVVLPHVDSASEASLVCELLMRRWAEQPPNELSELPLSFSAGISIYPDDALDVETMIRHADTAMYEAKMQGRSSFRLFTPAMTQRPAARMRIESELRKAIRRGDLKLHYQPKVDADTGAVVGAEALMRWQVDGRDVYRPDQFVPVAEETGLIGVIGKWALQQACRQAATWHRRGHGITIAVNVAAPQFLQPGFRASLQELLAESELPPQLIELELTERMVMSGGEQSRLLMREIKELGVSLALDDFGTGYSSLSYLKHFPIDVLKIPRTFVRDVATDSDSAAITEAIITMAQSLAMGVVAEGVETAEQAAFLRAAGCTVLQGFLFGPPMPAEEFATLL
ncbi:MULTISPECIES: sensor domain-containing protein [Dyella]|uniref:cyclic-guanylate-specific phosphodiesterase n=2 Tax=Dyella TaxID=231454 RepID=A0A4R0YKV4_9GAMM|nr:MULTISPECIES: GGDEF and EAL domain-containing protein [Dyella]TBR36100.1 GGDEF and EAL domain-containing protein [Dyella terrae]TCI06149.1 GGDEF and EAL domain-containing protein [Dyella soli]